MGEGAGLCDMGRSFPKAKRILARIYTGPKIKRRFSASAIFVGVEQRYSVPVLTGDADSVSGNNDL
jgi:hypothetical protein|tara:strand:+ start:44242 stop:44439 length:198 start_codon:yes stop_codon:yes gene_type:complete